MFQKNTHSSYLLSLFVILSFLQLFGYSKNVANAMSEEAQYGLTTYAEPCTDECKQRGFPYTWCHKKPSRNGTWIDRDYCSQLPGTTRYLEPCLESCHQDRRERSGSFYWCRTAPTPRGDWDYCSPFPRWLSDSFCFLMKWGIDNITAVYCQYADLSKVRYLLVRISNYI